MLTLNLINKNKSDVSYDIIHFPDGEVHVRLGEINRKDNVKVMCRITNSEDLFILMQVGDILNRQEIEWKLFIYYLMSMRMDRVISFNESYSLKIVAYIINSLHPTSVKIAHPHSIKTINLINYSYSTLQPPKFEEYRFHNNYQICFPDKGAYERYGLHYHSLNEPLIGNKNRNLDTGKIESITIQNPESYVDGCTVAVVDDLCDSGGTLLGIAEELRKINKNVRLEVSVVHMVNRKGLENLSKTYDKVIFTNSYKDWKDLPNNCEIIDILN